MSKMISVASGFQNSINIGYDLNSNDKLNNFIPTKSAMRLLEEILLSTFEASTERSRILIGAYGKGKSHIVLMILSILMKRDISLFVKMLPKLEENQRLFQLVQNYYESSNKILPVVISGSNTSLSQAFLQALQRTLSDNDLLDIMPETNYRAAISTIKRWKIDFPETYALFQNAIDVPIDVFVKELAAYSITTYETFEHIYPALTSGSVFNPFLGFDVVELYESVATSLRSKGYTGIYIVYDEFSKYLEANITKASISDTKMLQDFAEKCNRSGSLQLHLMLISHKEIANYIDKLPKQKVDGWRGVSERFKHIHLNNNFSQTYEIIASVIQKDVYLWKKFVEVHKTDFFGLVQRYQSHPMFSGNKSELKTALYGCYPLHPISTFILPRLSERVAQNERTLFTFLSSEGTATLPAFLRKITDTDVTLISPDLIYDYFEPLFKKEIYSGVIHDNYILAATILEKLPPDSLEAKIVKTISLIYALSQFELLKPTKDEILGIYSIEYTAPKVIEAIENLINREYVIYLKRSNDFLKLKQTSGVDIRQKIHDYSESTTEQVSVKDTLNAANFNNYMFPSRYNDNREMTRFFSFLFIDESEIGENTNWIIKSEGIAADGIIYAVIPHSEESIPLLKKRLLSTSCGCENIIFILPKHFTKIKSIVREYEAVRFLREAASNDVILFDEYDVIYEDLREVINGFIAQYTQPEKYLAEYLFDGCVRQIRRKAALTELMSDICDNVFSKTPVINNEAVNKDVITSIASNSRGKIIAALLRTQLEKNLGLTGTGQEVSIMRSTMIRTGILSETGGIPQINLRPDENGPISNMLDCIENFILSARHSDRLSFSILYDTLILPKYHLGMRKGLIPIYLATVMHNYKQQIVVHDRFSEVPLSADLLLQINANPDGFSLSFLDWDIEKETFAENLSETFRDFIVTAEKGVNRYDYIVNAMRRWVMSLPKYAKDITLCPNGKRIDKRYLSMLKLLKHNASSYDLLFDKLPKAFGYTDKFSAGLAENLKSAKIFYDNQIDELKLNLIQKTKDIFMLPKNQPNSTRMSLVSVVQEWCESLDHSAFSHIFSDGTEKCLELFKTITNDEMTFIARLAKACTDLRVEDWDNDMIDLFCKKLKQYKSTAQSYLSNETEESESTSGNYRVTFVDEDGKATTKTFERIEHSKRGMLLYNQITQSLDAMGHSISEQEKRQILMEILKKLC